MAEKYRAIDLAEQMLGDYDSTPDSYGFDLRLDLAELIVRGLKAKGWTQRQLAKAAGVPEQTISKYINSATNFECDTAGTVLFCLGIKPRLAAATPPASTLQSAKDFSFSGALCAYGDHQYGPQTPIDPPVQPYFSHGQAR